MRCQNPVLLFKEKNVLGDNVAEYGMGLPTRKVLFVIVVQECTVCPHVMILFMS